MQKNWVGGHPRRPRGNWGGKDLVICHINCIFSGQVLTYENIQEVIKFCAREKLVLFADEVYQDNVYADGAQFHSCKKVLRDLGAEYSAFQLFSLHSSAKGYTGE